MLSQRDAVVAKAIRPWPVSQGRGTDIAKRLPSRARGQGPGATGVSPACLVRPERASGASQLGVAGMDRRWVRRRARHSTAQEFGCLLARPPLVVRQRGGVSPVDTPGEVSRSTASHPVREASCSSPTLAGTWRETGASYSGPGKAAARVPRPQRSVSPSARGVARILASSPP